MLCDDVMHLRIVYLVMASASAWSSAMSKELYDEALQHLAPLGTVSDDSTMIPGQIIRQYDRSKAHNDIYEISQLGEKKRVSINSVSHLVRGTALY
jgi:hypothetical protein